MEGNETKSETTNQEPYTEKLKRQSFLLGSLTGISIGIILYGPIKLGAFFAVIAVGIGQLINFKQEEGACKSLKNPDEI